MKHTLTTAMLITVLSWCMMSCTSKGALLENIPSPAGADDGIRPGTPGNNFVKNILVWEFATTDCIYCPYIDRDIKNVQALSDVGYRIFATAIHGQLSAKDPFQFSKYEQLEYEFSVGGAYPVTVIDHDESYLKRGASSSANITKAYLQHALDMPGKAGLQLSSKVDGKTATLQVKLKTNEAAAYKIAVSVLESGLVYPQSSPGTQGIDSGYVHEHVLRAYLTDLLGDVVDSLSAGDEYTKTYRYKIPDAYNIANLEFLVYLLRDGKAVNSQLVKIGQTATYQYLN